MNKKNIFLTFKKEINTILRDKKSLIVMLLTPLIIPFFFIAYGFVFSAETKIDNYNIGINYELTQSEKLIFESYNLEAIRYKNEIDLKDAFNNEKINAYITKENNNYKIYANSYDNDSYTAAICAEEYLKEYNLLIGENKLIQNNIDPSNIFNTLSYELIEIEESDKNEFFDAMFAICITYVNMIIILTAINCAMPSTAGEKENGTLETLLTFPIRSNELITGKFLATFTCTFINALISFLLLLVTAKIIPFFFEIYRNGTIYIGFNNSLIYIVSFTAASLLYSGISIALASCAKTIREAQSSLQYLTTFSILPMFLDLLEIESSTFLSLIPIVNFHYVLNDTLSGNPNYLNIAITIVSSVIYIIMIIKIIAKQYKSEKVLFG